MSSAPASDLGDRFAPAILLHHESSLRHETGAHPEQPARIAAIELELKQRGLGGWERMQSAPVERAVLSAVHPDHHIERIERASAAGARLDPDTVASPGSFEAALHACGGAVMLVDRLLDGSARTGFSIHRPPGHHAEQSAAMGFCLFNNIAVGARHALDAHGLERVLIVDWDVHHGNGTNDIFRVEPRVLFCSIHQSPLYPGTGPAADVGSGAGRGFTVNMPVAAGSGDLEFVSLVEHVVVPLARAYGPQLVLVSAGFDAHVEDPLADCRVTEDGFAEMARSLVRVAAEFGAPLGAVLEGGYALKALGRSVAATMEVLGAGVSGAAAVPRLEVADESVRYLERLRQFWPGLG